MKTTEIELPSEGKFYPGDHPLSEGKVTIEFMSARHEDILTDRNLLQKGEALDKLIEAVIVDDSINLDDMLVGDKGAIILATRIGAYGPQYAYEVSCSQCSEKSKETVDLTEIESKEIDFDEIETGKNEFTFDLPVSEKTIKFKLLTHEDSQKIDQQLKNTKRGIDKSTGSVRVSGNVTTRLKNMIVEVDGERSQREINNFVDDMYARDSHELRKFVRKINPDLDLSTDFFCDWCGNEEVISIPLDANFLFPTE